MKCDLPKNKSVQSVQKTQRRYKASKRKTPHSQKISEAELCEGKELATCIAIHRSRSGLVWSLKNTSLSTVISILLLLSWHGQCLSIFRLLQKPNELMMFNEISPQAYPRRSVWFLDRQLMPFKGLELPDSQMLKAQLTKRNVKYMCGKAICGPFRVCFPDILNRSPKWERQQKGRTS